MTREDPEEPPGKHDPMRTRISCLGRRPGVPDNAQKYAFQGRGQARWTLMAHRSLTLKDACLQKPRR